MSGVIPRETRATSFAFRRVAYLWLSLLACAPATTQAADRSATSGPPDSVIAVTGVFRVGMAHHIAIAPFRTPAGWTLLMADEQSDQLRLLARTGRNAYVAGRELTRPTPEEWTLRFTPDAKPAELAIEEGDTGLRFTARRIQIDVVPIAFHNGAVRLEGSLYRPALRGSRLPLIALAHGSEDNDRF